PAMPERVHELAVALAPDLVGERLADDRAGLDRTVPGGVDVADLQVQDDRRALERLRRDDAELGELVGEHHLRVAEPELDLHETAVGYGDPAALLRAERLGVPRRRLVSASRHDVRR